jgi:ketosteroid isomerase-like protein
MPGGTPHPHRKSTDPRYLYIFNPRHGCRCPVCFWRHESVAGDRCVIFLCFVDGHDTKRNMKTPSFFSKILLVSIAVACQSGLAQSSPGPAAVTQDTPAEKAIKQWYAAWENKDWNLLEQTLADGFTFSSPLDDHIDVKHVKERCWPNAYNIKRFDVAKLVMNGDDVFVISDGWTTSGKLFRNCDYFKVKDGKISAYECFFGPGINFPNSGK